MLSQFFFTSGRGWMHQHPNLLCQTQAGHVREPTVQNSICDHSWCFGHHLELVVCFCLRCVDQDAPHVFRHFVKLISILSSQSCHYFLQFSAQVNLFYQPLIRNCLKAHVLKSTEIRKHTLRKKRDQQTNTLMAFKQTVPKLCLAL